MKGKTSSGPETKPLTGPEALYSNRRSSQRPTKRVFPKSCSRSVQPCFPHLLSGDATRPLTVVRSEKVGRRGDLVEKALSMSDGRCSSSFPAPEALGARDSFKANQKTSHFLQPIRRPSPSLQRIRRISPSLQPIRRSSCSLQPIRKISLSFQPIRILSLSLQPVK